MNLYELHTNPKALYRYEDALQTPRLRWEMMAGLLTFALTPDSPDLAALKKLWIQDPYTAVEYATHAGMSKWPEAEPIISTDAYASFTYARWILGKPWEPGEDAIFSDPEYAIKYAYHFDKEWDMKIPDDYLKKILPEIISSPKLSRLYAIQVLKDRFPPGEPAILTNPFHGSSYRQFMYRRGYEERSEDGKLNFYPRADYVEYYDPDDRHTNYNLPE